MALTVISPGTSAAGGNPAWGDVTGKPTINTSIGNPGSDSNLVTEQAVREGINELKDCGLSFSFAAPDDLEYELVGKSPIAGTITEMTAKLRSGSVSYTLKINGTNVTGLVAVASTSTRTSTNATAANVVAQGDIITILFASAINPVDFAATIAIDRD